MGIGIMIKLFFIFSQVLPATITECPLQNASITGSGSKLLRYQLPGQSAYPRSQKRSSLIPSVSSSCLDQFILNKKSMKTVQHQPVNISIPFKKWLIRSEQRGNQQYRNFPFSQLAQIVIPIVIFNPEYQVWIDQVEKFFGLNAESIGR